MPAAVPQMMKLQVNNFMFTVACDDDDDNDDDDDGGRHGCV